MTDFYYNQARGVVCTLCGRSQSIAMWFDAITDPIVGPASDNLRPRWEQRHPFMYICAIPMSVPIYFVFVPPNGLWEFQLFIWLTAFAVSVRSVIILFIIPRTVLMAELSQDYHELNKRYVTGQIAMHQP